MVQVPVCRTSDPRVLQEREQDCRERRRTLAAQRAGRFLQRNCQAAHSAALLSSRRSVVKGEDRSSVASQAVIEQANLKHIDPTSGKSLCDIAADDIAQYQASRLEKGAAPKTVNLEVGTLRAILRKNRLWVSVQPDVKMLRVREDVGRAISRDEETALLEACRASRSRSLYPAVLIALNTCMRYSELRLLHWGQIDLNSCTLTVGLSKTNQEQAAFFH